MLICVVQAQLNCFVFWGCWKHKVLLSWTSWASLPPPAWVLSARHNTIQFLHILSKTPLVFALVSPDDMYFCYTHT